MQKNTAEPGRIQMTIWRVRFECWIPKATNTYAEYIILTDFPLQQQRHARASMLSCTYAACLVKNLNRVGCVRSMKRQLWSWKKSEHWLERKRKQRKPVSRWLIAGPSSYWIVAVNQTIVLSLKLIKWVLKDSVPTAGRKCWVSIAKTSRLLLFMKVIFLFSKNYTVTKGQIFNIKTVKKSYHLVEMRNHSISERNGCSLRTEQKIHLLIARPSVSFTHVISRHVYIYL